MDYAFQGLPVVVDYPRGSKRPFKGGERTMYHDYGYIDGYMGADGEDYDVYVGPDHNAEFVYIIHQMKRPEFTEYDEDKAMLGFPDETSARDEYLRHYNDDRFYGGMSAMPIEQFKDQLEQGGKITHAILEARMRTASDKDNAIAVGTDETMASPETTRVTDEDVPHPVDSLVPTRTAAVEFERPDTYSKGQKLVQISTGRECKVLAVGAHTATVEFTDGMRPGVRNVWLGDLGTERTASKQDARSALREFVVAAIEEEKPAGAMLTAETSAALEKYFDEYVLAHAQQARDYMRRERAGDMRELQAQAGKNIKDQLTAVLAEEDLRESIKDGMWNGFIQAAAFEGWQGHNVIPPSLLRRVLLELTQKAEEGRLTDADAMDLCLIERELGDCVVPGAPRKEASLFEDASEPDEYDSLTAEFDEAMGFRAPDAIPQQGVPMHIGEEKTAGEELPFDIFSGDSSGDYTVGEQMLSTMTVESLMEERPRLLAERNALVRKGVDTFLKAMKTLKADYTIEDVSLKQIVTEKLADYTGVLIKGALHWNVRLCSHQHRRRASLEFIMPVIAGEPVAQVEVLTSMGKKVAFTREALDEVMHIRRNNTELGKGYTTVTRSFINEK